MESKYANEYQKIKVSKTAYLELKEIAKRDEYRGRGLIGAFDDILLGRFTTSGSGNYDKNKKGRKTQK